MNRLSLFWHLKKGRGKWLITGFVLNLLLLFSLSLDAYFRPYYQHTNAFRDTNTFTLGTFEEEPEQRTSESILSSSVQEGEDIFDKIGIDEKCEKKEAAYLLYGEQTTAFFTDSSYNLLNLGYLPDDINKSYQKGKTILLSRTLENQESYLSNEDRVPDYEKMFFKPDFVSPKVQFNPLLRVDNLIRAPLSRRNEIISFYRLSKVQTYFTYHLNRDLKDQEFNRLSTLSGGTSGVITSQFSTFIHPAKSYFSVYIPIHNVVQICLYLCSVILAVSFFASILSDYLKSIDKISDIRARKVFGRNEKQFILMENLSLPLTLAFTDIASLILYVLFRLIFKSVKGFSFYFSPVFLLLFIGEILFSILIQSLFSHRLYSAADKKRKKDE